MREILAKPEAWTTDYLAKDGNGQPIDPLHPLAKCFCLMGAVALARHRAGEGTMGIPEDEPAYQPIRRAIEIRTGRDQWVHQFNDAANHDAILGVIDTAIEFATKETADVHA